MYIFKRSALLSGLFLTSRLRALSICSSPKMSCCPPNSHVYLDANYSAVGAIKSLPDGTEIYTSGQPGAGKNGVLIVPDIYGWNGGRVRAIADQFAEAGYYSVVPKILQPAFEGGTDGDGLRGDFDFNTRGGTDFPAYISTITWADVIKPRVTSAIAHMKAEGILKIASIGFCWGGISIAHICTDFADDVVCGVIPHPSFRLEDMIYKGSSLALIQGVKRPLLLLPAGNDPENIKEGGEIITALQAKIPESATSNEFEDMKHGWSVRGDVSDPNIKAKVELALEKAYAFISKFL